MFSSTPFMNLATTPFGPQFVFEQSSVPASTSSVTSFGSSTEASVFGGASASPLSSIFTTPSSLAFGCSSSGFGGGEARLPTFGIIDSEQSTFGVIRGGSRETSYTGTAEVDSAHIAGRLVSISAMHAHKDKCHEELRWEDYKLGDKGTQVRISTCDGIGSGQSDLGSQYSRSKLATYTGTLEVNDGSSAGSLLSLSAMPVYQNRSHEELRWEDHQLKNRGEFAVGPACLQSNPFSNPLSRSDNSSLNPISSSMTSNIFAPRTPSFRFPSSEVSTPAFSWPPFSTLSFGNSIWTTSSSKPPCTAPMAGSNSSPSLSGPFRSPTFAQSPSLASSVSPTCHSSENPFTSTPSNPFLHPFTSVFGGASMGVFGATASPLSSTSTLATTSSPAIRGSSSGFGGGKARLPTFGIIDSEQSTFGVIRGGSRATSYTGTAEVDSAQIAERLVSISAVHAHKDKCHEELRWEDYKLGDKGTQVRISTCDGIGSGQSALGSQYLGNKLETYTGTLEVNCGSSAGSLLSLSAMPVYQNRSHEELRWEDHQLKNRGEFGVGPACLQSNPLSRSDNSSPNPISSSITSNTFAPRTPSFRFPSSELSTPAFSWSPSSTSSFGNSIWTTSSSKPPCTAVMAGSNSVPSLSGPFSSPTFAPSPSLASSVSPTCHSSENPFTSTPSNPFLHQNSSAFTFPAFSTLSTANFLDKSRGAPTSLTQSVPPFGPSTFSSFSSCPPTSTAYKSTPSIISSSALGTTSFGPNLFDYTSTTFAPSPSICSSTYITVSHAALVPDNSSQSLLALSLSPPPPSISSCTVAPGTASRPSPGFSFVEITPSVTQKSSLSKQITSCSSGNPNTFTFPSTTPGFKASFPNPFQQEQTSQTGGSNGIDGVTKVSGQIISAQQFPYQSTDTMKQSPVASPFRTLPTVPQMLTDGPSATPVVSEKPSPVRSSSLLTIRHLSHRKNRLPTPKCNPKRDGPNLPFFSDAHMTPSAAKAEALLPGENPRSLVIGPTEEWNLMTNFENSSVVKHTSIHVFENGNVSVKVSSPVVDGSLYQNKDGNSDQTSMSKSSAASAEHSHKLDGGHDDNQAPRGDSAIVDEPVLKITYSFSSTGFSSGADVMKLMPKLRHTDYYVEPRIEELAVKESSKSGFCSQVKDFVVGRLGYGSIVFLGETDIRELDVESHVQFNDHEVVVYMDETKKPPVGQGLNKPAEITLCNIKCIDKKTGKQYIDGPKVDKYKEMLMKKTAEQGAEFVSYDPVQGDWKFKVQHF